MFRLDTRSIADGEEPFESLVPKPFDRHLSQRNLMRYRLQGILKCPEECDEGETVGA